MIDKSWPNIATCKSVGVYHKALSRGRKYKIIDESTDKIKLEGNDGRIRWFPKYSFIPGEEMPPCIKSWEYASRPADTFSTDGVNDHIIYQILITLNDMRQAICLVATPLIIGNLLSHDSGEKVIWAPNLIIVNAIDDKIIDEALLELERRDELMDVIKLVDINN